MSTTHDQFGAPTTASTDAMSGINDFVGGFVAYETRSVNVLETADALPDCALANIYAGFLWMFLERPEAPAKALPYLERARAARTCNDRERGLLTLLDAWQQYDVTRVNQVADDLLHRWPQDLSTLKVAQYHLFNRGDASGMLALARRCEAANADRAPVHSMIAFGHEQCNELEAAADSAQRAMALDASEPWAHHCMAHIHLGRGTVAEGRAFLVERADSWQHLNSFMFTHNWWHLALFEIAGGDVSQALAIYDDRCWGVQPEYSQDQIGAVSLLARLELAGVDVGQRWAQLLPYLNTRADDITQPFLTLQYLYGLARAGAPQAADLLALCHRQPEAPVVAQDRELWRDVALPAAIGVHAHAVGDYGSAARWLGEVRSTLWRVGGSHAQRDLFDQLLLDARIRTGQHDLARAMLQARLKYEPDNPVLTSWLESIRS